MKNRSWSKWWLALSNHEILWCFRLLSANCCYFLELLMQKFKNGRGVEVECLRVNPNILQFGIYIYIYIVSIYIYITTVCYRYHNLQSVCLLPVRRCLKSFTTGQLEKFFYRISASPCVCANCKCICYSVKSFHQGFLSCFEGRNN